MSVAVEKLKKDKKKEDMVFSKVYIYCGVNFIRFFVCLFFGFWGCCFFFSLFFLFFFSRFFSMPAEVQNACYRHL